MAGHLVTVATYRALSDALLAKGKLDAAGIHCVLATPGHDQPRPSQDFDPESPGIDGFRALAYDDVKLQVSEEDAETATQILTGAEDDGDEDLGEPDFEQMECPSCGSLELSYHDGKHWRPWVGIYLAGAATMDSGKREWRCEDCGAVWSDTTPEQSIN